jgi:hypothetical protein
VCGIWNQSKNKESGEEKGEEKEVDRYDGSGSSLYEARERAYYAALMPVLCVVVGAWCGTTIHMKAFPSSEHIVIVEGCDHPLPKITFLSPPQNNVPLG